MTASALEDDRQAILDCGVDAYLSKPVEPTRLFGKLQQLLHLHYESPAGQQPEGHHATTTLSPERIQASVHAGLRQRMCQALEQGDMAQLNGLASFRSLLQGALSVEADQALAPLFVEDESLLLSMQQAGFIARNSQGQLNTRLRMVNGKLSANGYKLPW